MISLSIEEKFLNYQLCERNELLTSVKYADEILMYCNEHKIALIGMEGVILSSDKIIPQLDWIYDGSRNFGEKQEVKI